MKSFPTLAVFMLENEEGAASDVREQERRSFEVGEDMLWSLWCWNRRRASMGAMLQ